MIVFNFQSSRITFPAFGYWRFQFLCLNNLLLTSPSFIRIQFTTLKLVFVINYFCKAFVQFSSHSIELILEQFLTRGYARAYHELLQGDKDMQMSHSLTRSRRFRN